MNISPSSSQAVTQYPYAMRILHGLLAVMILIALFMGTMHLESLPNSDPEKINALRGHMIAGSLIFVLMCVRVLVRRKHAMQLPPHASTGMAWADKLAPYAHTALYVLVFLMTLSGIGISIMAGLPEVVFMGQGSLPTDFNHLPPRWVHGIVAKLLILTIVLHVAAAFYHQLVRKDGLLSRMSLRK